MKTPKEKKAEMDAFRDMVVQTELEARFWTAQADMKASYIRNHELGPKYTETYEAVEKMRQEQQEAMQNAIQEVQDAQLVKAEA